MLLHVSATPLIPSIAARFCNAGSFPFPFPTIHDTTLTPICSADSREPLSVPSSSPKCVKMTAHLATQLRDLSQAHPPGTFPVTPIFLRISTKAGASPSAGAGDLLSNLLCPTP